MIKSRKLWVEALRSGKYKQAKGMFKRGNSYCCLGVAQIVAQQAGLKFEAKWGLGDFPQEVANWLELGSEQDDSLFLAHCNDGDIFGPHSFDDIAFLIENLP